MYLISKKGEFNAKAIYSDGTIIVKAGTKIRMSFADHIRGGKATKKYRDDPTIVDERGITKKDCNFTSPSTAAQFVMGSSVNGWYAWHIDKKTNLKKYMELLGKGNV